MKVSSEALFHFTKSRNSLENILIEKFKVSYCKETYELANIPSGNLYFPMISFCDLPIGLTKEHIDKYGNFAIGMTKEWGIKHKLNPVLYLENNSNVTNEINNQFNNLDSILNSLEKLIMDGKQLTDEKKDNFKSIIESIGKNFNSHKTLLRFIKNYQGDLIRENKTYKDYKFYDEREWRFVPNIDSENIKWKLDQKEYEEYRGKGKKKTLLSSPILEFDSNDIKYLIVKSNRDIPPLIRKIRSINKLCASSDEADILITKILTVDSLNTDF